MLFIYRQFLLLIRNAWAFSSRLSKRAMCECIGKLPTQRFPSWYILPPSTFSMILTVHKRNSQIQLAFGLDPCIMLPVRTHMQSTSIVAKCLMSGRHRVRGWKGYFRYSGHRIPVLHGYSHHLSSHCSCALRTALWISTLEHLSSLIRELCLMEHLAQ